MSLSKRIIKDSFTIRQALATLDEVGVLNNVLFIVNADFHLISTLTDGDIRRALLKDLDVNSKAILAGNKNFKYIVKGNNEKELINKYKSEKIRFIPFIEENGKLIKIIDLYEFNGLLPLSVVIMAGGKGQRLLPLTKETPKPMLKIGNKPIIEHNIDRLIKYGIDEFFLSVNYLKNVITDYFKNGESKNVSIKYLIEDKPLGTIGSISLIESFKNDYVLLMNSDLLTNIDFEDFFNEFVNSKSDMAVAAVPYYVDIPYAVLETNIDNEVLSLKEKPRYIYYSNAGIYLFKKELINLIPKDEFFNATDLMEKVIAEGRKLINFPILNYWLDIGKMPDYLKAQEDIKHLQL
jgi:dTDP-glucose pyrophosphorylase